jgi:integrase
VTDPDHIKNAGATWMAQLPPPQQRRDHLGRPQGAVGVVGRYWTPAQLGAFLSWSERDEDELFVAWQLLAATGVRRGEVLELRWATSTSRMIEWLSAAVPF